MTATRIGITGASGYIGAALVSRALAQGCEVVTLGRRGLPGLEHRHADLREEPAPELLQGLDALIHLAADTRGAGELAAEEIRFADALAAASKHAGVRLLVVSSQAASPTAPSAYGRTKAAIEERVLAQGATVLRPGMVYGGAEQGLFGTLTRLVDAMPLLPDLRPRPQVQPIHVEDLADCLLAAVLRDHVPGRVRCAAGEPLAFIDFLEAIARHRLHKARVRIPVPLGLLRALLAGLARVLGPAFAPERLDSLAGLPLLDCGPDLAEFGVTLRQLPDGLSRSGRPTRRLLREGRALMHAFLARRPSRWLARRYVRALRRHGSAHALPLPERLLAWPSLIGALDGPDFRRAAAVGNLAWRYGAAIRIVEADTGNAEAFLGSRGRAQWLRALLDFSAAAAFETQARCLRPLARRALRKAAT